MFHLSHLLLLACLLACSSAEQPIADNFIEYGDSSEVYITDQTGKKWDITHAVEKYGFDPSRFRYGLGPNAIAPITHPIFLSPGDAEYPSDSDNFQVIGVDFSGERRAYPLYILNHHEVVDEYIAKQALAVTY